MALGHSGFRHIMCYFFLRGRDEVISVPPGYFELQLRLRSGSFWGNVGSGREMTKNRHLFAIPFHVGV